MPKVSFRAGRFFRVVLGFPSLTCLLCAQPVPDGLPTPSCSSSANCNARGTAALKAGKIEAAVANFIEELRDAEEQNEGDAVLAFNNLSVAYLRQHNFLQARFWAQQALDLDPKSPAAVHYLGFIKAGLRSFHWPASPNGAYVLYIGCGLWDEIRIGNASASAAKLSFQGVRIGTRGCHSPPAAIGKLEGEIAIQGKSAIYAGTGETAFCRIQLQFRDAGLSVEEDGQCGFGAGVHANEGDYQRISIR